MKIMVAYDKDDASDKSLEMAVKHAKAFAGEVLLVTSRIGGDKTERPEIIDAKRDLEEAKNYLNEAGVSCETHLLIRGFEPGEDIVLFAQEQKVDQIIIGIKRRSKVGKFIFGSTAQVVVLDAHCPVLAVYQPA